MKIAIGLSELAFEEILKECNHHCKEKYKIENLNNSFRQELNNKIDCDYSDPSFSYEIPQHETVAGAPYVIDLRGHEYFKWLDAVEDKQDWIK